MSLAFAASKADANACRSKETICATGSFSLQSNPRCRF
jgi:hypothetical protein